MMFKYSIICKGPALQMLEKVPLISVLVLLLVLYNYLLYILLNCYYH